MIGPVALAVRILHGHVNPSLAWLYLHSQLGRSYPPHAVTDQHQRQAPALPIRTLMRSATNLTQLPHFISIHDPIDVQSQHATR